MRLNMAGPRLTPMQMLSHPSLGYSGSPNMAPTMALPPNPYAGPGPEALPHVGMPEAPSLPSPWLAALMGGISGAADAANGTNTLGGLTGVWGKARQTYADAQAAAQAQNSDIDLANQRATQAWTDKRLGFDADIAKTDHRYGQETQLQQDRFGHEDVAREDAQLHALGLEGVRYGHETSLVGLRGRNERGLIDYRNSHPAPKEPKDAPPVDAEKVFAEKNPVLQQQLDAYELRQKAKHGKLKGKDLDRYNALLQVRQMLMEGYSQPTTGHEHLSDEEFLQLWHP